jgi:hypothetical protein
MLKVAGGAFYNRIFAVQAYGVDGFVAIGSAGNASSWDLNLHYASGATAHGLDITKWRFGWSWDWTLDRFRAGLGPNIGHVSIQRATDSHFIETLFVGLDVHASLDVIRVSELSAFFASASFKVDGGAWGPVLQIGFRGEVLPHAVNRLRGRGD